MIALLLNSGLGSRMGNETREHPKCMTEIAPGETIISWQVKLLERVGVTEAVVTTGHLSDMLEEYLLSLNSPIRFRFVHNPATGKPTTSTACTSPASCWPGMTSSPCTATW